MVDGERRRENVRTKGGKGSEKGEVKRREGMREKVGEKEGEKEKKKKRRKKMSGNQINFPSRDSNLS